jgi:hypothetical protein
MKPPKNQTFLNNATDPVTKQLVKEIWRHKFYDHNRREKWDLIWNYYRDRGRQSVEDLYRENRGKKIKIIFSGDPIIHEMDCPIMPKKIKIKLGEVQIKKHESEEKDDYIPEKNMCLS